MRAVCNLRSAGLLSEPTRLWPSAGIIIETTGMADPGPVAQTFFMDESIKEFARLDGIVTLVDAKHIEQHLDEEKAEGVVNEAAAQVAFADRLLLNKTDLVTVSDLDRIESRLRGINLLAPVMRCTQSQVSVESVLNIHGFDLKRALQASPELLNPNAPKTKHDGTVSSVSLDQSAPRHLRLVKQGALDLGLLQTWIGEILKQQGNDVFRMKGILAIAHAPDKYVYHAVHMIFDGGYDLPWAEGETRECKMVFIGRNLDAKALAERFNACLATPENMAAKAAALRFAVGDRVECRTGQHEWSRGTVHALNYRDERMQAGMVAPYQVLLDGDQGRLIWAPKDIDQVVRMIVEEEGVDDDKGGSSTANRVSDASMRDVLHAIGLERYTAAFEEQGMEFVDLRGYMKQHGREAIDRTLQKLGVASVDDRTKIADACAFGNEEEQSPSIREALREIGLEQYADTFEGQDIEVKVMKDFVKQFGRTALDDALKNLGVASVEHRTKIAESFTTTRTDGEEAVVGKDEWEHEADGEEGQQKEHDHDHAVSIG